MWLHLRQYPHQFRMLESWQGENALRKGALPKAQSAMCAHQLWVMTLFLRLRQNQK
jgi:hypothetical protein